ncbi:MAG: Sua5/YciO/YrdC/YwlC family protein, partial [Betaproteobacteria bacterium]
MNPDAQRAAAILRRGGLVAFPTETVYGLGADASNAAAMARLYAVKGRPGDHPVIVHFAAADAAFAWASEIPDAARRLAAKFWPGPLTLVLKRAP